ncbi:MAG: glutamine synthetase type III [Chlorobi bacterium]|nr:glutamine synthetase type III [Chlorobiota bacterium]
MSTIRFKALEKLNERTVPEVTFPSEKVSDYFGSEVFDLPKMQKYLSKEAYQNVLNSIETGSKINRKTADQIAAGMKEWATSKGATHYTHWFHPLTGNTAEKHDAFISIEPGGNAFETFDGELLVQQEPDASSFPHGGLRNTFEARGYTAWDPASPAFIIDKTLCIPTIFVSYTGEALDYKTPLLKSLNVLDKAAAEVCNYFDKSVKKVFATLGWEQEYFLIDEALFKARPDLILTGRTLMGHASAKDQQLSDHYFSSIPERVIAYMKDFENEAHKLGIPLKTRHNEVAPNQFECAPVFEEANLANDHNQLLMKIMRKVAEKHHFKVLFHEKPFAGINGSGKHNNWSLATDTGINLLKPGNTPKTNLMFLTFLVNIIAAVKEHSDLLRAAIMSAGNQHRLGANEAPPAIISVFLGSRLDEMLNKIEQKIPEEKKTKEVSRNLKLDIAKIPEILLDNTDRNRTSPFAFTGNRFEFRAVGSNENNAGPLIALNTAVADRLKRFKKEVDKLIDKKIKRDDAILQILRKYITESKDVRFEGNGYSPEWEKEAKKRGLSNIKSASEAFKAFISKKTTDLYERNNVLNSKELQSRYEIRICEYVRKIQIESRILGDLAINHIIPTAIKYQNILVKSIKDLKDIIEDDNESKKLTARRKETVKKISVHTTQISILTEEMTEERKKANILNTCVKRIENYEFKVKPYLDKIRYHIDKLELIVDDELWPLPKYRELLFNR